MKKFLKFVTFFIFFMLLLWPFYVILIYTSFSTKTRFLLSVFMFIFEIILGLTCVIWSIMDLKIKRTKGKIFLFIITLICFLIYSFSLLNTYVIKIF